MMMKRQRTLLLLLFFMGVGLHFVSAADITWVGGTGLWSVASNWMPAQVPGASDVAIIKNGEVILDASPGNIQELELTSSAKLSTTGTSSITISIQDTLLIRNFTVQAGANAPLTLSAQYVDAIAQSTLSGSIRVIQRGTMSTGSTQIRNNNATGTFEFSNRADETVNFSSGNPNTFENLTISGNGAGAVRLAGAAADRF